MKNNDKLVVLESSGLNVSYLAMNTDKPPFNNPKVRQAINFALNRDGYIKAIYKGNAIIAKNPIPPSIWSYDKKAAGYQHDIKKAKKLPPKQDLRMVLKPSCGHFLYQDLITLPEKKWER